MRFQPTSVAAAILTLAACSPPQANTAAAPAPTSTEQAAPTTPVRSRGIVQTVTREYNAITIQHEAIPEYDMPAMVMEFTVDNSAQLEGIEAGDVVRFELRSGLDISTISEVEAAP